MSDENRVRVPVGLLVLDFVGVLLILTGLYETLAASHFVPPDWRFPGYNWVLVVVGALLALPLLGNILKQAARHRSNAAPETVARNR